MQAGNAETTPLRLLHIAPFIWRTLPGQTFSFKPLSSHRRSIMRIAVITFTYNEKFNLPLWVDYYGSQFGRENLFVVDRGSDDGSVDKLDTVNLLRVPRKEFDEFDKTNFLGAFQNSLLSFYDLVIVTDCDELLIADPSIAPSLRELLTVMPGDYGSAIGLDLIHLIDEEPPIDASRTLLSQRSFARFSSPECKCLVSKVPLKWLPGLHSCDRQPMFLGGLYIIHTKMVDFFWATARQKINLETTWSKRSVAANFGAHHRYSLKEFVHQSLDRKSVV